MKKKGFALITVLVITLLLLIIATVFVNMAVFESKIARNQAVDTKVFFAAEAGYNHALQTIRGYPGLVPDGTEVTGNIDNISYNAEITMVSDPFEFNRIYKIVSISTDPITGARKKITVTIRIQTYAKYSYFTTQEVTSKGTDAWFVGVSDTVKDYMGKKAFVETDQVSDGLTHTNGRFNIFHNPEFWSYVSSVDEYVMFYPNKLLNEDTYPPNHIPVYMRPPFERGAAPIEFPTNLSSLDKTPPSKLLTFPANSTIVLNGTQAVVNGTAYDIQNIWVIKVLGDISSLSGVLDGYLTIGSEGKIFITDNLVYQEETLTSDDILGLYAYDDIVVKNDENISANEGKSITIDASIMTLNEFRAYEFGGFDNSGNPIGRKPPARLLINGGVIQNYRGILGHFNPVSSLIIDGYTKDWRYDDRLINNPPPFFPTTGEPIIVSWKEEILD